jgi:hypothetical protein
MDFKNIYHLRKIIKKLAVYEDMSPIQRKIFLKRNNLKAIEHSIYVIRNIGYDSWESQTNAIYWNKKIIESLIDG